MRPRSLPQRPALRDRPSTCAGSEPAATGKTDDTKPIERAIKAASDGGGGQVYLPAGTYLTGDIWIGRNGNGATPSVTGIHIVGDGMDATVLLQKSTGGDGCLNIVDASRCSVRDLTIDSSKVRGVPKSGGLLLFGCQECLIENSEVRGSSHRSITIAGRLFGKGRLPARNTVVRGCVVRGQRYWNGNAAAQIIAGNGARATTFVDCVSIAEGFTGDLFGADDAPATVFKGCRAMGQNTASAGFWIEHGEGERPSFLSDCYVEYAKNVGIGGKENAERLHIQNCHLYRVARRALWGYGVGRIFIDGCLIEECGASLKRPYATLLLEGGGSVTNTRIANNGQKALAVSLWGENVKYPTALVRFDGCIFDGDFQIGASPTLSVTISGCTFLQGSKLVIENADESAIHVNECLFVNLGLVIEKSEHLILRGNVFRALDGYAGPAISSQGNRSKAVSIGECVFHDYKSILGNGIVVRGHDNRYVNCRRQIDSDSVPDGVTSAVVTLKSGQPRTLPFLQLEGAYFVLVSGTGRHEASAIFAIASGGGQSGPEVAMLVDRPADSEGKKRFQMSGVDGKLSLSFPGSTTASVTVVRSHPGLGGLKL